MADARQWYDRKMPEDWGASPAEWDWYCFRTKGKREDEARRGEEARLRRETTPEKRGATAGWRQEKRAEDAPADPNSTLPRGTVSR